MNLKLYALLTLFCFFCVGDRALAADPSTKADESSCSNSLGPANISKEIEVANHQNDGHLTLVFSVPAGWTPIAKRAPVRVIYFFPSFGTDADNLSKSVAWQRLLGGMVLKKDVLPVAVTAKTPFWLAGDVFSDRAKKTLPHSLVPLKSLWSAMRQFELSQGLGMLQDVHKVHRSLFALSQGALSALNLYHAYKGRFSRAVLVALPDAMKMPELSEFKAESARSLPWENLQDPWDASSLNSLIEAIRVNRDPRPFLRFLTGSETLWNEFSPTRVFEKPSSLASMNIQLFVGTRDEMGYFEPSISLARKHMANTGFGFRPVLSADHSGPYNFAEILAALSR